MLASPVVIVVNIVREGFKTFLAVQDSSIGDLVTQSLSHVLISDYSDTTVTLQ